MLLTIDVGNTNIKVAAYEGDILCFVSRLSTDTSRKEDQYAIEIRNIFNIYNVDSGKIDGAIIGSVVPKITEYMKRAIKKLFGVDPVIVRYDSVKDKLDIAIVHPEETGADLIAGCIAAKELYAPPCIVVDLGTATKLIVVDKDGRMIGGCIIPGVSVSLDALVSSAALLSAVSLETPPHVIGNSTVSCIQSGVIYGAAAMIDGLCDRIENELGYSCQIIATGGLSETVVTNCTHPMERTDTLVLDGLRLIYEDMG